MTAMTRSASMTPSSMSLASSEASLTLCNGTLRTSIGAGTAVPLYGVALSWVPPRACEGWGGGDPFSGGEHGAGVVTADSVGDVFERRDDGAGAAPVQEAQRGLDLGAHAAAGELALSGVLAHLLDGHPAQRSDGGGAEVHHHVRDVGRDDQRVGVEFEGQDRGGEVLVDDGLDPAQSYACAAVIGHRDATAPGADDDETGRGQCVDRGGVDHGPGLGGGDHSPPATLAAVLPGLTEGDEPFRFLARQKAADRLRELPKARVVRVDQRARDQAGGFAGAGPRRAGPRPAPRPARRPSGAGSWRRTRPAARGGPPG